MRDFIAIDVETASRYVRSSICQIAVVRYSGGKFEPVYSSLVNPEIPFDPFCTAIHGISEKDVQHAPVLAEMLYKIIPYLMAYEAVAHNAAFDMSAIMAAMKESNVDPIDIKYGCTLCAARRIYHGSMSSFSLPNVCSHLGVDFINHHDAMADAVACAEIAVRMATQVHADSIDTLMSRCGLHLRSSLILFDKLDDLYVDSCESTGLHTAIRNEVVPNLPPCECSSLHGKHIVITGELTSMSRPEAEHLATAAGAIVKQSVSRKTNILVVGIQNLEATKGSEKSAKHRRAEELNADGYNIAIIGEAQFRSLLSQSIPEQTDSHQILECF